MKKNSPFLILFISLFYSSGSAQVGIGTPTPSPKSVLDVTSTSAGVLLPRVTTAQRTAIAPAASDRGLQVFDTTTGSYWYWDGTIWVEKEIVGNWKLAGNAGTNPSTNYIGTSNATDLKISTAATERIRVLANGQIAINNPGVPLASDLVTVSSSTNGIVASTSSNNVSISAITGFLTNTSSPGSAVKGVSFSATGFGMGALNTTSTGTGILGIGNNYGSSGAIEVGGSGGSFVGAFGSVGYSLSSTGWGVLGRGNTGTPAYYPSGTSGGGAFTGVLFGVYGSTTSLTGNRAAFIGNYDLSLNNIRQVLVGAVIGGTEFKIQGTGAVSTIIQDENNSPRILFCPEAPEVLFEDYGIGTLVNGETYISLDPILKRSMKIDDKHPLKVFIQLEGECNGVYVTQKSEDGFKVKELNNGTSNISFSWHIVGNRKDTVDENGNVLSKFEDLRLPVGPKGPLRTGTKALPVAVSTTE